MKTYFVIYDMNDNYVCEMINYKELCNFFSKPLKSMHSSVSRFSRHIIDSILSNKDGLKYKVYKMKEEVEL